MTNLSKLGDIQPLNLSMDLTDPNILNTAVVVANDSTNGYLGLGIGVILYTYLMYISTKEESLFSFDFIKASVFSSGVTIVVMLIMLGLDLTGSFIHLMWFVLIFIMSLVGSYLLKDSE